MACESVATRTMSTRSNPTAAENFWHGEVEAPHWIKADLDPSNCFVIESTISHVFGPSLKIEPGEQLVVDQAKKPAYGDVVVLARYGENPFARRCDIKPSPKMNEKNWTFGHMDEGQVSLFRRKDFDVAGVIVGKRDLAGEWSRVISEMDAEGSMMLETV